MDSTGSEKGRVLQDGTFVSSGIKRWVPLIVWVGLIFVLSSIPNINPDKVDLPSWSDKIAHFVEYMIFALLYYRGLSYDRKVRKLLYFLMVLMTIS